MQDDYMDVEHIECLFHNGIFLKKFVNTLNPETKELVHSELEKKKRRRNTRRQIISAKKIQKDRDGNNNFCFYFIPLVFSICLLSVLIC